MRRFLIVALMSGLASTAQGAVDFQKVYNVPGMSADEIKQAYGAPTIDVGQDAMSSFSDVMNTASGAGWRSNMENAQSGKLRCNIAFASWAPAVNEWKNAEVILQVKDERARVTISNLQVGGPGKKQCIKSVENYLDKKFSTLKSLDNNW